LNSFSPMLKVVNSIAVLSSKENRPEAA